MQIRIIQWVVDNIDIHHLKCYTMYAEGRIMKMLKKFFLSKKNENIEGFSLDGYENKNVSAFSKAFHKNQSMDDFIRNLVASDSDEEINAMFREARLRASARK